MRHVQVLQKHRVILQMQQTEPLAAHAQRPVFETAVAHLVGCFAASSSHGWHFECYVVRVLPLTEFDQVRHQRMQAVNSRELFREIERRAEVIDAAIYVLRIGDIPCVVFPPEETFLPVVVKSEDASTRGQH